MFTLLLVTLLGLLVGVIIGLFSVFPVYFAGFIIYAFHGIWTPELLLVFWSVAAIGSQFFGSVSTICLGIPGEASSLVYIKDVQNMSLAERNVLLYQTAKGSLFAGAVALIVVWVGYHHLVYYSYMLTGIKFTLGVFLIVVSMFALTDRRPVIAILLLLFGILLGPNNNYALPTWWYTIQQLFEKTSFFLLIAGLMIIPDAMFNRLNGKVNRAIHYEANSADSSKTWWTIIKSTAVGIFAGSIPGPSAETAAALAYHTHKKQGKFHQIVAAETANNPGAVMMLLPFFIMGVPITSSALIISNVLDIKNVDIQSFISNSSNYLIDYTVFDAIIFVSLIATVFYFFLSTRFIDVYVSLVEKIYGKSRWLLFVMVSGMILIDMTFNETTVSNYLALLVAFTGIGLCLRYFKANPILLIFGIMFGDKLIWTLLQFYTIYFG
tara:strand:- start:4104 stop:5414 length:1311 start_codon:yes stop_codon:yes gene_type:complete